MDIKGFDILLLFILAITVALIIGINVVYVINKKLNDIRINVPQCPVPNVYIRSPSGILSKVEVENINKSEVEKIIGRDKSKPQKHLQVVNRNSPVDLSIRNQSYCQTDPVSDIPMKIGNGITSHIHTDTRRTYNTSEHIEGFDSLNTGNIEKNHIPFIAPDNRDFEKMTLTQGYNSSGNDAPNTGDSITYPDSSDIVRYNHPGCYKNMIDSSDNDSDRDSDKTVSINKPNQPICKQTVKEGSINNVKSGFMTANGQIINQNIDFYVPAVYMGTDPYIRDPLYTDMRLEQPANVDHIGSIPVNDYDGSPQPMGSFIVN